ncbi:MAG: YdeI/OmpD-associated family protein, partial [Methanotrichaceae archaeon]|nr:YdeI/OmpD-associated family protein [Methanotrichaceae archaeon]
LIRRGCMTATGLAKIEEAKKNGLWDAAYTNKKKERMPTDLKNALQQKSGAWESFQDYANSYRNAYVGWINAAKTEETRKRRIKEVVERAIKKKKPGMA